MSSRARVRLSRAEWLLLAAVALWALAPIAWLVVHALSTGDRLTGADGPIGADTMQYLAWARDIGDHGLASNLFDLAPGAHVYLQPMFALSGALWRLGLPLALAYQLWKPAAVVVLFAGVVLLAHRLFEGRPGARAAVIALSLFFYGPAAWIFDWFGLGSAAARGHLLQVAGETFPASQLWGYLPTAISIGLMPIALLALERGLAEQSSSAATRRSVALAGAAALIASWVHPWEGTTLLLILAGLAVWGRLEGWRSYALVMIAGVAPLLYYAALGHWDAAWHAASQREQVPRPPIGSVLLVVVPLALVAAAGVRRPGGDYARRAVLLWVPSALVVYFALAAFPPHALEALSLPLAVLAVEGWSRLRLSPVLGIILIAVATIPGLIELGRAFHRAVKLAPAPYYVNPSEARALDWVAGSAPPGGVLTRTVFGIGLPAQTGRRVWVGHQFWSSDYVVRSLQASALFAGELPPGQARALVRRTGARLLVADCTSHADLTAALRPLLSQVHRFGCATVYVLRP